MTKKHELLHNYTIYREKCLVDYPPSLYHTILYTILIHVFLIKNNNSLNALCNCVTIKPLDCDYSTKKEAYQL